jgi:hypothetical protein
MFRKNSKEEILLIENAKKLQAVLGLKPEKAISIAKAYEIDQVKTRFLRERYDPVKDGFDPLVAFAEHVNGDGIYREECNSPLNFAEEMTIHIHNY